MCLVYRTLILALFLDLTSTDVSENWIENEISKLKNLSKQIIKDSLFNLLKEDLYSNIHVSNSSNETTDINDKSRTALLLQLINKYLVILLSLEKPLLNQYTGILVEILSMCLEDGHYYLQNVIDIAKEVTVKTNMKLKEIISHIWLLLHQVQPARKSLIEVVSNTYNNTVITLFDQYLTNLNKYKQNLDANMIKSNSTFIFKNIIFYRLDPTKGEEIYDQIKKALSQYLSQSETNEINSRRYLSQMAQKLFTTFIIDFFGTLMEYEPNRLLNTLELLDVEFRNYMYKGCTFGDIFTFESRAVYNSFITRLGETPAKVIQSMKQIKKAFETMTESFKTTQLAKFSLFLDTTYDDKHKKIFENLIQLLNRYKTEDLDVQPEFRKGLRAILFDHVTKMSEIQRIKLGETLTNGTLVHSERNIESGGDFTTKKAIELFSANEDKIIRNFKSRVPPLDLKSTTEKVVKQVGVREDVMKIEDEKWLEFELKNPLGNRSKTKNIRNQGRRTEEILAEVVDGLL